MGFSFADLLFPKKCLSCGQKGTYFCHDCLYQLPQAPLKCPFCNRLSVGGVVHPVCQRRFGLDGLWSLGVYQGVLEEAIKKLKYKWVFSLAEDLVNITVDYWARYQPFLLEKIKKDHGLNWVIIPVPLHQKRQNWRGFNQSALLASDLAKRLGIEYGDYLVRTRYTTPQVKLAAAARGKNLKGAFSLAKNCQLKTKNCILVDDVWTTGATMKECCFILKKGGAKQVWGLTLAS